MARNLLGAVLGVLALLLPAQASALPDNRAWEMVSPVDKNGGSVAAPEKIAGGGVLQAAANGDSVTYGSTASFGPSPTGAPPASQYLARRGGSSWLTTNISLPLQSGAYDTFTEGVPYRLFSGDLARALHLNRYRCLPGDPCPVDYYLRDNLTGALTQSPSEPDLLFAGASSDLGHVVLSTCAALTPDAIEVPGSEGCDPSKPNLYRWSAGTLTLINILPAQSVGLPGAELAAQGGAVSLDGSRVYWRDANSGNLYLREGTVTKQVDLLAGGGGSFQTATADGAIAFFVKAGHLWRYVAATGTATDLTPGGGVVGTLGISAAGTHVYFQDASGLQLWDEGTTETVAPGAEAADPSTYPPTTGAARVSAGGDRLLFVSEKSLTGYNNADQKTSELRSQVFLYDDAADVLRCVSCRPSGARPIGPSTIPGSRPNGSAPGSPNSYRPRAMALEGNRVFFDTEDALFAFDTNADGDVYQWEAKGIGSCTKAGGCLELISSGRSEDGATFIDASADGDDVFFITDRSLVPSDPGSVDLYDARVGGGVPEPEDPIICTGDACQGLISEPTDPPLGTLVAGPGNPPVRYERYRRRSHQLCRRLKGKAAKRKCAKKKASAKRRKRR